MEKRVMIVVHVPVDQADAMRKAIEDSGGGRLGDYSYCSFSVKGTGRFLPNRNAKPSIGVIGKLAAVDEERIEVSCTEVDAPTIIKATRETHSHEEPALFANNLLDI